MPRYFTILSTVAVTALAIGATAPRAAAAAAPPPITDLGALPGDLYSYPDGLNEAGTVIGQSFSGLPNRDNTRERAVRWSPDGTITALPIPADIPHPHSTPVDINESGSITGFTSDVPGIGVYRALRWAPDGTVTELEPLPGDTQANPRGIAEDGTVAGYSQGPTGVRRAVKWAPDGTVTRLAPLPGETDSLPSLVNDNGTVVGRVSTNNRQYAVRWNRDGTVTDITAHVASPSAINGAGAVSGWGRDRHGFRLDPDGTAVDLGLDADTRAIGTDGTTVGCYYHGPHQKTAAKWAPDGTATALEHLPGDTNGWAFDINDAGTAVGRTSRFLNVSSEVGQAAKWAPDGTVTALGALPGATRSGAYHINSAGTVAGSSHTSSGEEHAVVWRP
ncbi:hypothetical protein [Saccharothrix syringae]|uniref:hypothetical protein n=1 Tax=Saccharothrix syringae TaxID=103733 RepID=UPI0005269BCD|nr:hypothetical protein [Saccharothrix syringae]